MIKCKWKSPDYYFFPDDIEKYPDAWCIIVWSRRGPGKTYSLLRSAYDNNIPLLYMKRTMKDVATICLDSNGIDLSPYVPINRDAGTDITPKLIQDGIGGFYESDEEGKPSGNPISYVAALNGIKVLKGMELSFIEWMCLDEFIPLAGERVLRSEGEQLLSVYMTVLRDRLKRGLPATKLILFANAEDIITPITNELGVIDDMANLQASGKTHMYLKDKDILLHHITDDEYPVKEVEKGGIFKAMAKTDWGRKAFYGEFSSNDFTAVKKKSLKFYKCIFAYIYKQSTIYVYKKGKEYYFSLIPGKTDKIYNLKVENEQKKMYYDFIFNIKDSCIEGCVAFEQYTMYDLVMNYSKIFRGV